MASFQAPDMGGPQPSIYGSFRHSPEKELLARTPSPASAPGTLTRSNSSSNHTAARRQPVPEFTPSGPQPYTQSSASLFPAPGPSGPPTHPDTQAQAGPVHYSSVPHLPPQPQANQQSQQFQRPPSAQAHQQPPQLQRQQSAQEYQQQPYGTFAGVPGGAASSIFSSPRPHGEGAAPAAPGAYYAPSSHTSSSGGPGAHGFPNSRHGRPQQPLGPNHQGSVYTTASYPSHGPQYRMGGGPAPSTMGNSSIYHGPQSYYSGWDDRDGSRMGRAGKVALGALAAGAVAYGMHGLIEGSSDEGKRKEMQRRQRAEEERQRRENDARLRREEEETRRREEHEQWLREENERYEQTLLAQQQQQQQQQKFRQDQPQHLPQHLPPPPQVQPLYAGQASMPSLASGAPGRFRSESLASSTRHSHESDGFQPPAPFGRVPYTFDPRETRLPDPSRSSAGSRTAKTYPELRQKPADTKIKIGTILALKHTASGRHLCTDRSHSTESGSNQQLVYAHRRSVEEAELWQVLPANTDTPAPGAMVTYGMQVRLRHFETGRHLHSHYGYAEPTSGQNEVTASGDQANSDENDHWVVERWGDGAYGKTWKSTDTVVLRHYVSGMVLHSHDLQDPGDLQPVTCAGAGGSENDQWRAVLAQ
ncbi:hypothetical protein IWQ56_002104 [Coemansia nantahalensis]|nr:hypothetical protein IWQ56_002104 [Coemansia nantahalensis]